MDKTEILIAVAGPVGLTAAIDLLLRGITCRIIDPCSRPRMGVLRPILDASVPSRDQIFCVNGRMASQFELPLLDDVPFGFIAIPQYATERVLTEEPAMRGVVIERGMRLHALAQDADGVTATLSGSAGESELRCRNLIGADGAHSVVRKGLGLDLHLSLKGLRLRRAVHARRP